MFAFLRYVVGLFLTQEDPDDRRSRGLGGPLTAVLDTDRRHLESLTRSLDRRRRE